MDIISSTGKGGLDAHILDPVGLARSLETIDAGPVVIFLKAFPLPEGWSASVSLTLCYRS